MCWSASCFLLVVWIRPLIQPSAGEFPHSCRLSSRRLVPERLPDIATWSDLIYDVRADLAFVKWRVSSDMRLAFRANTMITEIAPRLGVSPPMLMFLGCASFSFVSPIAFSLPASPLPRHDIQKPLGRPWRGAKLIDYLRFLPSNDNSAQVSRNHGSEPVDMVHAELPGQTGSMA